MIFYDIIWFKYDCFILNMVIISDMDTQHNIWYLPSESNHVMSTNGKVTHLLIIILINLVNVKNWNLIVKCY